MNRRRRLLRLVLLALSVAGIVALTRQLPPMHCAEIRQVAAGEFRPWLIIGGALLIFIAAPRWMVIAALGVAFGAWWGFWFASGHFFLVILSAEAISRLLVLSLDFTKYYLQKTFSCWLSICQMKRH